MEKSANALNLEERYTGPVAQVRILLQDLDTEIRNLCTKCAATKTKVNVESILKHIDTTQPPQNKLALEKKQNEVKIEVATWRPKSGVEEAENVVGKPAEDKTICKFETPKLHFETAIQVRALATIYRNRVLDAYRDRRIFTVYGNYFTIRKALLHRGWIEKLPSGRHVKLQALSEETLLSQAKKGNPSEAVAISKIINTFPPFFIWQPKSFRDNYADVRPYRNRVRRGRAFDFTTKIGLIGCAEQEHWYRDDCHFHMSYPRFYRLGGSAEERLAFIEDFRYTQCRCLLNFIIENIDNLQSIADEENGSAAEYLVRFALSRMQLLVSDLEHDDIDNDFKKPEEDEDEWNKFLESSHKVIKRKLKIKITEEQLLKYAKEGQLFISKIEHKCYDCQWDGCKNLWILKPGYQSQGCGIVIRNTLPEILEWAIHNQQRKYIAQKYIERPLLIYKTKFDIRQYMLLTINESVASIWLYKECYLRFSSHEYNVNDFREVIHLTNNSVQKRYKDKTFTRDPRLPRCNMWSSDQFRTYLKQTQSESVWEKTIFAGFRQNLVAVVLASFEETQFIENSFELYGCDFMLDEMYNPILIEINSTPDLSPSTEVTARICPNALKDMVKVVIDLPRNPRAPTGLFEKVYEINYKTLASIDNKNNFDVTGVAMKLHSPHKPLYKQRLMKRIIPNKKYQFVRPIDVVKATNKNENNISRLRGETKKMFKANEYYLQTETTKAVSNNANIHKMPVRNNYLRSNIKNCLALRYTQPK